jgi:hypothetical protein
MQRRQPILRIFFFLFTFPFCFYLSGQTSADKNCKPPINRARWHDLIDKEQKNILKADGKADNLFNGTADEEINFLVTRSVIQKVDALQCKIEKDTAIKHQKKVSYLSGAENIMKGFLKAYRSRRMTASNFPTLMETYETAINRDKNGNSIENIIVNNPYEVSSLLLSSNAFNNNPAYQVSRQIVIRKYTSAHPDRIFSTLKENPDLPFRDSLILIAAYRYPNQLYDFAQANNKLGYAIRKIDDPLVKAVSRMATSDGSGQLYFPFLDNIINGTQTIEEIDKVKDDHVKYYRLLVKTRLDYLNRSLTANEKLYGMEALEKRMGVKAREYFVKTINALHEQPNAVRFRILGQLNAQELYYLAVLSESEIYTSSYVNGVYPAIMQRIGNRGDSLLMSVKFDRYKKFIKMAAGFNTLGNFLNSFPDKESAKTLMTAFVNGLEKSTGLEDGVDVADSYASIVETLKPIAADMLENVKSNFDRNISQNNQRGVVIYNLLYKLFLSADSTNNIDLSREFGIPPVYNIAYNTLANDSQEVVMQVFFYGDKDGRLFFADYVGQFPSSLWKRTDTKQWVTFTSVKGKPIRIYANKPLPEESNQDAEAQRALGEYLSQKGLSPTVVVHRGHSYYAPYTIAQIQPSAKIVFLGSCGGYHLINSVLNQAGDAHIIASKQIGKGSINQPFFDVLNEKLRNGNNIEWIPFWKEFKRKTGGIEGFEDYIPPYKNLGAIFIKAYKTQMGETDAEG